MRIDIEEAGKRVATLGDYAQTGEKMVITKDGEPYLEIVACSEYREKRKKRPRRLGGWEGVEGGSVFGCIIAPGAVPVGNGL